MNRSQHECRPLTVVTLRSEPHVDPDAGAQGRAEGAVAVLRQYASCGAKVRSNRWQSASIVKAAAADPRRLPRVLARVSYVRRARSRSTCSVTAGSSDCNGMSRPTKRVTRSC
jgi:hypothetical protein